MREGWWLTTAQWLAVLRAGIGLWWLESVRHKNLRSWWVTGGGVGWGAEQVAKHPWAALRPLAGPIGRHRRRLGPVVWLAELAVGLGLTLGFLTPVAAAGGILLNLTYLVLFGWTSDGELGQNWTMLVGEAVVLGTWAGQTWSIDSLL